MYTQTLHGAGIYADIDIRPLKQPPQLIGKYGIHMQSHGRVWDLNQLQVTLCPSHGVRVLSPMAARQVRCNKDTSTSAAVTKGCDPWRLGVPRTSTRQGTKNHPCVTPGVFFNMEVENGTLAILAILYKEGVTSTSMLVSQSVLPYFWGRQSSQLSHRVGSGSTRHPFQWVKCLRSFSRTARAIWAPHIRKIVQSLGPSPSDQGDLLGALLEPLDSILWQLSFTPCCLLGQLIRSRRPAAVDGLLRAQPPAQTECQKFPIRMSP